MRWRRLRASPGVISPLTTPSVAFTCWRGRPSASARLPTRRLSSSARLAACRRASTRSQRQIVARVAADKFGLGAAAIGQANADVVVALDDVMRGHDQVFRPGDARCGQSPARVNAQDALGSVLDQARHFLR